MKESKNSLWQLAFRPFFLFGSVFSFAAIAYWLAVLAGVAPYRGALDPLTWHAHEMVFGFSTAIIAGFVMTAVQNWTGIRGVHGAKLKVIFALWALARVLLAIYPRPSVIVAALDLGFYPLLAVYLAPYLRDPELKIERVFFLFFTLFFGGNLLVHLESLGLVSGLSRKGLLLGLDAVVVMVIFMGGRVIPFFTESSIAKAQPRTYKTIEILSNASGWAYLAANLLLPSSPILAAIAFFACVVHAIRLAGWYVRRIRRAPIIWVLHTAYLWMPLGFALMGLAALGLVPVAPALHAFTVGAIGIVIFGMITRVSLGHTGRRLVPKPATVAGYYLINAAAVIRVLGPLASPRLHDVSVYVSGALWLVAFALFVIVYAPILTTPETAKG